MSENYSQGTKPFYTNPSRVLLVKILQATTAGSGGGGGGGSGGLSQGVGPPSAPPSNTAITNAYWDTSTGIEYYWNVTNQAWT